jgi:hypothetical protein
MAGGVSGLFKMLVRLRRGSHTSYMLDFFIGLRLVHERDMRFWNRF